MRVSDSLGWEPLQNLCTSPTHLPLDIWSPSHTMHPVAAQEEGIYDDLRFKSHNMPQCNVY